LKRSERGGGEEGGAVKGRRKEVEVEVEEAVEVEEGKKMEGTKERHSLQKMFLPLKKQTINKFKKQIY